jgi:DNA-directed RNA polymerase subunit beta'
MNDADEDVKPFEFLNIRIASPEEILQKSRGEIKKPETINYRTFKPEKGGLFCEKVFGPTRDWECACGKFKKIKNKGIVCDRCGVEVTLSKVRRERMAHIELAVPVVHIWFFKTMPSRIGNMLGMSTADLERVIYYEEFVVIDPGSTDLQKKQILNESELKEAQEKWGSDGFKYKMGGEAIADLLKTKSMQARMKLAKRLKIVEGFATSTNNPEWMVLKHVPVIPPDLRPLVPLDGGRFATSDLNDLYRRVINRNNRLKSILKLKTPDVIIRNEKRMLQEAVDALFDNGRHGTLVMGAGNRPLKALSEMLKGKQGRFRQNLLGKRVDYSGRSVIVVGPELKFNQCGLPKKMALDLFEPFIVKRLKDLNHVYTIRSAKKMIQKQDPIVWDVLEEIIEGHPVLLNRAPTLHRLGIQAFEPVLIEGKAIRIHPLVTTAFNADFDGDQMAVHIPLSIEAQLEAQVLMMAPDNIFLASSGNPVTVPAQDMILGLYYITHDPVVLPHLLNKKPKVYRSTEEVLTAFYASGSYTWYNEDGKEIKGRTDSIDDNGTYRFDDAARCDNLGRGLHIHQPILVRLDGIKDPILTTPGRVLFNTIVPPKLGFQNQVLRKKTVSALILECYKKLSLEDTVQFLDRMKNLGFAEATKAAISMGICDVKVPISKKDVLKQAYKKVNEVKTQFQEGVITDGERHSKIISCWTEVSDRLADELFKLVFDTSSGVLNPLYHMVDSGARGNKTQVKQLGAMRGLMAKPSGEIIESPITANFREGLTVMEYFISTHGARKGLSDTALKTADSGYLTRRLVDVAQDVIVTRVDCGTLGGIEVSAIKQGSEYLLRLSARLVGRTVVEDIFQPGNSSNVLASAGDILTIDQANAIEDAAIESVKIRSALTCESRRGICACCYGQNLASGSLVGLGEAIGIIAAQSIGEPGTQLTMRTFHLGGIASAGLSPELIVEKEGIPIYVDLRVVRSEEEGHWICLNKSGSIQIVRDEGRSLEDYKKLLKNKSIEPLQSFPLELGTKVFVSDGHLDDKGQPRPVKEQKKIAEWDQHSSPIICEKPGYVKYHDFIAGISFIRETSKQTGQVELIIKQIGTDLRPHIEIYADADFKELVGSYPMPSGAVVVVREGQQAHAGMTLAKLPRGAIKTKDITGGLPRVAEIFEARRPRDAAEIAKIDGIVDFEPHQKNKRICIVMDEVTGMKLEHPIHMSKHMIVQKGDMVVKGQQLTEGLVVLQDLLDICGVRELQKYVVNQVQEVYRLQGVEINDKHIEIIVRQMLQKVRIIDPGDTTFLHGEDVDKKVFHEQNRKAIEEGIKAATAAPILLGITRASLGTESFISAASFQETTRVLTEAACESNTDFLLDIKAPLIMGRMIPCGTGFEYHKKVNKFIEALALEDLNIDFESEALLTR